MDPQNLEQKSKQVFQGLAPIEPSPYFSARVLAHTPEPGRLRKEVLFWRWIGALSVTAMICLTVYTGLLKTQSETSKALLAFKPYVIHVDLDQSEVLMASSAELVLPEGLSFYSKDEEVKALRSLKLPLTSKKQGGRLPFVVVSSRAGHLPLQVRLYDENDRLIETKTMNVEFVEGQNG